MFGVFEFMLISLLFFAGIFCLDLVLSQRHYTDCDSLNDEECQANFWDCESGFGCEADSLPPLQLVFLIDTTLEDQTYYTSLVNVYNFLDEILSQARFAYNVCCN